MTRKLICFLSALFLFSMSLQLLIPVVHADTISGEQYENNESKGTLYIKCNYSSDITPQKDDIFTISYTVNGLMEPQKITVNGSEACEKAEKESIKYGRYCITDINYDGKNTKIANGIYGSDLFFDVIMDEEADTLYVAIGREAGIDLESKGDGVIAKSGDQSLTSFEDNADEYYYTETNQNEDIKDTSKENSDVVRPSESEKKGEIIYYDQENKAPSAETHTNLIYRIIPLAIIAAIVFCVIFVLHKKGKI